MSYVDTQIGKIMAAMHELGLAENTIVVFWGDHGYHLGEQNLWCKSTNFEKAARVPLIISVPGEKGQSTDGIVEAVDVYPTLADLCGLETRELAGRTLRPFIEKTVTTGIIRHLIRYCDHTEPFLMFLFLISDIP